MQLSRLTLLAVSFACLSGCSASQDSATARSCQDDIRGWLPNPTTAEFLEFKPISQQEYVDGASASMLAGFGDLGELREVIEPQVRNGALRGAQTAAAEGGSFHRYEIKLQDRTGRIVQSQQSCLVTPSGCSCVSPEEMIDAASRPRP